MTERPKDGVEHQVQILAHVLTQEAQDEVAVLLQKLVLAPIAAIRHRIGKVLRTIQLHGDPRLRTQEVDFQRSETVEGDFAGPIRSIRCIPYNLSQLACLSFLFYVVEDPMERANLKQRRKDVYDRITNLVQVWDRL